MAVVIGVLLIIVLSLAIIRALVGTTTRYTVIPNQPESVFDPAPGVRTAAEIGAISDTMSSEWCVYEGVTPPLRLKIRGQSLENYARITRLHLDEFGRDSYAALPPQQQAQILSRISADAYVVDWEGALYPNGNPLPFTQQNLMAMIEKDSFLWPFIQEHAHRLSPPWPTDG